MKKKRHFLRPSVRDVRTPVARPTSTIAPAGAMPRFPPLLLLLVLAAARTHAALYAEDGPVAALTGADLQPAGRVGRDASSLWVVEYYADGCGACQAFAPEYIRAADKLRGIAKFGALDCGADMDACARAGVAALPTVKVYGWQAQKNPYKPRDPPAKTPVDFNGERNAKALSDFVTAQLPRQFVQNVSFAEWQEAAAADALPPLVLLFSAKADAPLYKALSLQFRGRLRFTQARADDAPLAAVLGLTSAPAVVVRLPAGDVLRYDGPLKAEALAAYLEQHAAPAPPPEEPQAAAAAAPAPAAVLALQNASHFSTAVLASEPAALVAFLGGSAEACAAQWDAWRTAAKTFEGQVITAEANASATWAAPYVRGAGEAHACVAVARFPFSAAEKADADAELYEGELEGRALGAWALEAVPDFVAQVTGMSAESYFSQAPRMPKVILVSSKTSTPPMFRALAANFNGRLQFAIAHSGDQLATTLRVERAPAVRAMLVPPDAQPQPDGSMPLMLQEFPGPLRYDHLAMFCDLLVAHAEGAAAAGVPGAPREAAPQALLELTDEASLRDACEARGGLCVMAFLDSRAAALPAQQALLRAAAARSGGAPVQFTWVDASRFPTAAAAFDLATTPSAVVLSARKLRYAPLRAAFSADTLAALVADVLAGRVSTAPLAALPQLVEGQAAAADAAPAEEEVEEEFDLSDILGVEVESASHDERRRQAELAVRAEAEARVAAQAAQAAADAAARAKPKPKKKKKKAAKAEL